MERLSSGKRINSAMEDAAGLTIAHSLDTKIVSLEQAARNAHDAISLIHLGEGALDAVSSMLVRMRELATQALNGTYSDYTDRVNLQAEFSQLQEEITRVSSNTYFNGISVIGADDELNFQIGFEASDKIVLNTTNIASETIGSPAQYFEMVPADGATVPPTQTIILTPNQANAYDKDGNVLSNAEIAANISLLNSEGEAVAFSVDPMNDGDGNPTNPTFVDGVLTKLVLTPDDDLPVGTYTVQQNNLNTEEGFRRFNAKYTFTVEAGATAVTDAPAASTATIKPLSDIDISSFEGSVEGLWVVEDALFRVDRYRVTLGAVANRLDHSVQNLYTRIENQTAARSRIEDADYAVESAALARAQILQQAGTAMLAQANASTQNVLSLLK
jgi:flagellin